MSKENYLNIIKELPDHIKQFSGLAILLIVVLSSFFVLNIMFGEGDELVKKMKIEEERIAQEKKLSELISKLPSGILVSFDGSDHYKLTNEIYTINGNKIDETFVEWDKEKNKCFAGFTVSGDNVGVNESVTVSGEALSFLSTGIDTRVYFIKNF